MQLQKVMQNPQTATRAIKRHGVTSLCSCLLRFLDTLGAVTLSSSILDLDYRRFDSTFGYAHFSHLPALNSITPHPPFHAIRHKPSQPNRKMDRIRDRHQPQLFAAIRPQLPHPTTQAISSRQQIARKIAPTHAAGTAPPPMAPRQAVR